MGINQSPKKSESISQFLNSLGYTAIPLKQNVAGQLLISAKINDGDGVYILDTGAGTTVVDAKQTDALNLKLNYEESEFTGGGVGAHGMENVPSYNNKIEIGNFRLDSFIVAVMPLGSAWSL
jgi:predicted aspartyl protease